MSRDLLSGHKEVLHISKYFRSSFQKMLLSLLRKTTSASVSNAKKTLTRMLSNWTPPRTPLTHYNKMKVSFPLPNLTELKQDQVEPVSTKELVP